MTAFDSKLIHLGTSLLLLSLATGNVYAQDEADAGNDDTNSTGRSPLPGEQQLMQRQAAALPADSVLWLGEGEDRFLVQYRPAVNPLETALLIVGNSVAGTNNSASISRHLYTALPQLGWSALHIEMPDAASTTIPERQFAAGGVIAPAAESTVEDPPASEGDNKQQEKSDNDQSGTVLANRLQLSLEHLLSTQARSAFVIASGKNASRTLKALPTLQPKPTAIVLLNTDLVSIPVDELQALAENKLFVLDVIDSMPEPAVLAETRRKMLLAGFADNYLQLRAPYLDSAAGQQYLERRIRKLLQAQ